MVSPILGKDKVLKFRLLEEAEQKKAAKLALQVEHTITYDTNSDSQQTKDGPVNYSGGLTSAIELTAVSTRDEVNEMLRRSVVEGKVLEVWEIDLGAETSDGKYPAKYGQGILSEWEEPANVEEAAQFTTTLNIDGFLQEGTVQMSADELEEIQYAFRGTDAVTGA